MHFAATNQMAIFAFLTGWHLFEHPGIIASLL